MAGNWTLQLSAQKATGWGEIFQPPRMIPKFSWTLYCQALMQLDTPQSPPLGLSSTPPGPVKAQFQQIMAARLFYHFKYLAVQYVAISILLLFELSEMDG